MRKIGNRRKSRPARQRQSASVNNAIQSLEKRIMFASAFTSGYLAVERIGTGAAALGGTGIGNAVVIDEFDPAGGSTQTPIYSDPLPTAVGTGTTINPLTVTTSFGEGLLSLSQNGQYLVLAGYAQTPNSTTVLTTSVSRVVGRIDAAGNIDTTTAFSNAYKSSNIRGAASVDGTAFWTSGVTSAGNGPGIQYIPFGGTTATQVSNTGGAINNRAIAIFNNQVYTDSNTATLAGVANVGPATAPSGTVAENELNGFSVSSTGQSPEQFVFKDANTIYVADASITTVGGVQKWTFDGTTWHEQYTMLIPGSTAADSGLIGIAIAPDGTLYGTTTNTPGQNRLVKIVDNGSGTVGTTTAGGTGFTITTLATSPVNENFKSVSMTPVTPVVASIAASPSSIFPGQTTNLSATVTESGGTATVSSVKFYREFTNGSENTANDILVGTVSAPPSGPGPSSGTTTNGVWTLNSVSTTGLGAGAYFYYAVATDTNGLTSGFGTAPSTQLTINNATAPTIQSFTISVPVDNVGSATILSANNVQVTNPDTIDSVNFYYENNSTPGFQSTDTFIAAGVNDGSGNYKYTLTPTSIPLASGAYTIYAVATAHSNAVSIAASASLQVVVPHVNFDLTATSVVESATNVTITVDRNTAFDTTDPISIPWSTVNGTAVAGTNFGTAGNTSPVTGTISFTSNNTAQIVIPLLALQPHGGDKTFTVTLGTPTPAADGTIVASSTQVVTIKDDTETFNFSTANYFVNDNVANAEISVIRSGYAVNTASVTYSVTGIASASGTLNFAAGQQVGVITVPVTNISGDHTFTATISSPTAQAGTSDNAQPGTLTSATDTVIDIGGSAITNTLSGTATAVYGITVGGGTSEAGNFAPVAGDVSQKALSYDVVDFSKTTSSGLYPPGSTTVTGINNLSIQLYNTNATVGNAFNGIIGNFNVYVIPDVTTVLTGAGVTFDSNAGLSGTGLNTSQFSPPTALLLGTFSFNDAATGAAGTAGYDTYTATGLSTNAVNALEAALNNAGNVRLAVTPENLGVGAMYADWDGIFSGQSPKLAMSATFSATPVTIKLTSPPAPVDKTSNTFVTITVSRDVFSGDDVTSFKYSTSDITAHAGSDYTGASGVLVQFPSGQPTVTFTIPIANDQTVYGDKTFSVTINNFTVPSGFAAIAGSPVTEVVTIRDTRTYNISSGSALNEVATVVPATAAAQNGVRPPTNGINFWNIQGVGTGATTDPNASFAVADFNDFKGSDPSNIYFDPDTDLPPSGQSVTSITGITLSGVNSPLSGVAAAGIFNVYVVTDASSPITSAASTLKFDTTADPLQGLGSQLGTKYLLGTFTYDPSSPTNAFTNYALTTLSPGGLTILENALNNANKFRIVVTPGDSTATAESADFRGSPSANPSGFNFYVAPEISINYAPFVIATTPAWIDQTAGAGVAGTDYTWNGTSHVLDVINKVHIIGDPGTIDEPIITTHANAVITVDVADPGTQPQTINFGAITLTGATMTVNTVGSHTATHHDVVVVGTSTFSIDGTSKLNIVDNDIIVKGGSTSTITSYLKSGFNAHVGYWNGAGGIDSTGTGSAAANTRYLTTIGVRSPSANGSFDGVSGVTTSDVLIKYTFYGDADLNGTLNGADYTLIDQGFGLGGTQPWSKGDFNYDGVVNGSDFALIDNATNQVFATSAVPLAIPAAQTAAVFSTTAITDDLLKDKKKSIAAEVFTAGD